MISIVVVAAGIAPSIAIAQPALAGATRPKLEVLQALPESQLFLLMNLVGDSLGVRCDYCHVRATPDLTKTPSNVGGWVWDSDDKPQKRTAREMMKMVVDLNARRFGGESRVTCYTCHRGATKPTRLPPQPPRGDFPVTVPPPPLPSADRVWTAYVNAVGQATTTASGTGIVISGWDERIEGRYGKFEVTVAGPDRYRMTISNPETTTRQGLNGDVGWAAVNDRIQRVSGDAVRQLRRAAIRYLPVKAERPANLQVVGIERLADRDVYVAAAKLDATTTRTLYFDIVTGLLHRDVITTETLLLPLEEQVEYADYREVNGLRLPFWMRTSDGAPYDTATRTFNEIRVGVPIDNGTFRPPEK